MTFVRRCTTVVSATALALGLAVGLTATPASAATYPSCTQVAYYGAGGLVRPEPAVATGNHACTLGRGNQGEPVRVLQKALNLCYGQNIRVDAVFGPQTETAMRNVQQWIKTYVDAGLTVDGIFGPRTHTSTFFPEYWYAMSKYRCGNNLDFKPLPAGY
ncbi:peptidoglycan-binding domain-containing protein [Dactylosporangium sp. NPDC005572]|uniref:peptidoglycan-binding domain-containing protein n=1 Tax=Dactylosporangium sp. NPDC005572 TaxID=3156889 RepID=UPI0033AE0269